MARVAKASSTLAGRANVYSIVLIGALSIGLVLTTSSPIPFGLLLLILVPRLTNRYMSTFSGRAGERRVADYLQTLPESWLVYNDITLEAIVGRAQIDHLVLAPTGLILWETKNLRGLITARGQRWTQHLGSHRTEFYSPVNQALGHERVVRSFLAAHGLNAAVKSYVVFTNSGVRLSVPREVLGVTVATLDEIGQLTVAPMGRQMDDTLIQRLNDLILEGNRPSEGFVDRVARQLGRDRHLM